MLNAVTDTLSVNSFTISGHYRDPFLGRIFLENTTINKPKSVKEIQIKVIVPWPNIIYGGMIKNQKSSSQIAMININQQDNLMKVGDEIYGIQLLKIYKDSILVSFQKEKRMIVK